MCAPIPPNKWSWKFDKCRWCETRKKDGKHKHKGRGLCMSCWDKERGKSQKRKQTRRKAWEKWYLKFKETDGYLEIVNKHAAKWRTTEGYQKYLQKVYKKLKFKRIILNQVNKTGRLNLKRNQGLQIKCDGCLRSCLFVSPIKIPKFLATEKDNTVREMEIFKKEIIKLCK